MRKTIFFAILAIFFGKETIAQQLELTKFERQRIAYDKKAMLVLGSWSAANILAGAIGTNTSNNEHRYFNQMTVIWNGVNLMIAGFGYWGATREKTGNITLTDVLRHQNTKEKTFLVNAGLDIAYITGGLYLKERSRRQADPAKLQGYGNAVIMQGGFLFLFDVIMYSVHHRHGKQLGNFTDKIVVSGTPMGLSLVYHL